MQERPSPWRDWATEELAKEFRERVRYFYGRTDGTIEFPNSAEGDLLKIAYTALAR